MIDSSIIITAEKKEKFIIKTINSCIKQNYKNFEIIVAYTKLKNLNILKKRFAPYKIFFIKVHKRLNNRLHDQLNKIEICLKISRGENIFLLDGDDILLPNKLAFINKVIKKKEILIIDNYSSFEKKDSHLVNNNNYKNSIIYKKFINDWPKNVCTSCISVKKKLIKKFYKDINFNNYEFLAIDILLTIYCQQKGKFIKVSKILTQKKNDKNSTDKNYAGITNYFYWKRRLEQHKFNSLVKRKKYINLDLIITFMICKFISLYQNL
jgi:glycosyltransferase involved in cell wall biosynthesis|tara:strand:+ start:8243 stop:9040 length:798 start_codon:yes stop_codon:yes gene_type:complete